MHNNWRMFPAAALATLVLIGLSQVSCGHVRALSIIDSKTILAAARSYREGRGASVPAAEPLSTPDTSSLETADAYALRIASLLEQRKFEKLDEESHQARTTKARLLGGTWKLFDFYNDLIPSGESESDYNFAIARIKEWVASRPQSATARIALANAYEGWASLARGNGYANTVTENGWRLFHERTELAKAPLLEAARLSEKCPYWYSVAIVLALDEGWDKSAAREIVDQANLFEPTYYHVYRIYMIYLLPKWYGDEGDAQAFAEEISNKLGETQGSIVYYELASVLACQCDSARDALKDMAWPRIKNGVHELQRLYGVSNLKWNRYAYMAYLVGDKTAAQDAFTQVGPNWQKDVWNSADTFDYAKTWAFAP